MQRFTAYENSFGPYATIILQDRQTDASAEIALRGATLLSLSLPTDQGSVDVIGGYHDPDDFQSLTGARSAILAPYSNRIEDGRYQFNGFDYQFEDLDADGNSIHGLVTDVDWTIGQTEVNETSAMVELVTDSLLGGQHAAYPFSLMIRVRFTLSSDGLECELSAENLGESVAPVGLGWHPYLQPPSGDIRHCQLTLPHRCAIAVDDRLIPLTGQDAYIELDGESHDFSQHGNPLQGQALDVCYCGPDSANGWIHSQLYDPESDIAMTLSQEGGVVHIYTSHGLPHRLHEGLALEPNEFIPNAFNRPELDSAIRLLPGRSRTLRSRISARVGREI